MTTDRGSDVAAGPTPDTLTPPRPEPTWTVEVHDDPPALRRVAESLLAVADGRIGTRGTREEDGLRSTPMVMAAGVYRSGGGVPESLPGPLWFRVPVQAGDTTHEVRWLDLRDGVLHRVGTGVESLRFASLAEPGTLVMRVRSTAAVPPAPPLQAPPASPETATCSWQEEDRAFLQTSSLGGITAVAAEDRTADDRVVDRIVVVRADASSTPSAAVSSARLDAARRRGVDRLLADHRRAWALRWSGADVTIDGDAELQRAIRFALHHLMASVADHGEAAVGARGLSGPAYAGHVFWDADVFVLPFLAATHPAASRAMLQYRIARLPAARERALAEGRDGARFPWESAHDGSEATPASWVGLDGRRVPIRTGEQELHITADVAWAAWQHVLWSGEHELLTGAGRGLLVDTAAWWASRAEVDPDGRAHLRGVIGPDEYHPDVDDNAYTNVMAAWNLRRGADLLGASRSGETAAAQWRDLADALVTGRRPDGHGHEQFAGFDDLEEVDMATLATPPVAADVLLGHDRVRETQVIKQADVLMLHHLVPEELPPGTLEVDLDHYLPRTSHGSSLSPGVHASLLARAGRTDEAAHWLWIAARLDLDDLTGTTAGGLHLAAMGSVWQALVTGFLGVRPRPEALLVDPRPLPTGWRRLAVRVAFHGHRLELELQHDHLRIDSPHPVPIITPGRTEPLLAPCVLVRRDHAWHPEAHHGTS